MPIDSHSGYQKMDELRSFIQLLNPIITLLFQKHRFSCHLFSLSRPLFQELSLLSVVLVNFLHIQSSFLGNEFRVYPLQRCFLWSSHTFRSHPLEKTLVSILSYFRGPRCFPAANFGRKLWAQRDDLQLQEKLKASFTTTGYQVFHTLSAAPLRQSAPTPPTKLLASVAQVWVALLCSEVWNPLEVAMGQSWQLPTVLAVN